MSAGWIGVQKPRAMLKREMGRCGQRVVGVVPSRWRRVMVLTYVRVIVPMVARQVPMRVMKRNSFMAER